MSIPGGSEILEPLAEREHEIDSEAGGLLPRTSPRARRTSASARVKTEPAIPCGLSIAAEISVARRWGRPLPPTTSHQPPRGMILRTVRVDERMKSARR